MDPPPQLEQHPPGHTRLLMIVETPFWERASGSDARIAALIAGLATAGFAVQIFYSPGLRSKDRQRLHTFFPGLQVHTPPNHLLLSRAVRRRLAGLAGSRPDPAALAWERRRALRAACERWRPHILLVEYLWSAYLVEGLCARLSYRPLLALDTHDVLHLRGARLPGVRTMSLEEEVRGWRRFDLLIAIQEEEACVIQTLCPQARVVVAGHPCEPAPPVEPPAPPVRLLFAAAEGAHNEVAIRDFLREVWPVLQARHAGRAVLQIVGRICTMLKKEALPDGVQLLGFVEDLEACYRSAHIVINPAFAGSGLKIKNVDALCHALPLVTTPHAAEGFPAPGGAFAVCQTWNEMGDTLSGLINSPEARETMARAAHAYAQAHLRAEQVYAALIAALQDAAMRGPHTEVLVSVVVPVYNAARHLSQLIEGLIGQDHPHWELHLIDDGSSDNPEEVAAQFPDARIHLHRQENSGVSIARNTGLAAARGDYVLFLDADDWLLPGALSRMLALLHTTPEAVLVYGEAVRADQTGRIYGVPAPPLFARRPHGEVAASVLARNFIVTPGVALCRTEATREVGGFDPTLRVAEDWVFWVALAARGPFLYLAPPPILAYRDSGSSVIRTAGLRLEETVACIEAAFRTPAASALPEPVRTRARRKREAGALAFVAVQHLKACNFREARAIFAQSLRRNPGSLREWVFLGLASLHWLPAAVERRLK